MAGGVGLRERKKVRTREAIFDAARRLFDERGFDAVTVADVARAAEVSEVTVFNYFPTKEDLFYGGMEFFEERLLLAVQERPRGETPAGAFRSLLVESAGALREPARVEAILKSAALVSASRALAAREREIVDRYTRRLAELLAQEHRVSRIDAETLAVAAALIGGHRAIVEHVRAAVRRGLRGDALVRDARVQVRRVYGRLERGLGDCGVRA